MIQPGTYRWFVKVAALLLLIGVSLPTGLCAKQLMEFCHTDVSAEHAPDMHSNESHCPMKTEAGDTHDDQASHDCEDDETCDCHIEQAKTQDPNWISPKNFTPAALAGKPEFHPVNNPDFYRYPYLSDGTYSTPPLFLLNSTFLN